MPTRKPRISDKPTIVVPDDPAEYQRFLDIAREVGADEDEGALDRAFDKVIKRTPHSRPLSGRGESEQ